jgi:hypothetical protein
MSRSAFGDGKTHVFRYGVCRRQFRQGFYNSPDKREVLKSGILKERTSTALGSS